MSAFLSVDQPLDLAVTLSGGQAFRWREGEGGSWAGVLGGDVVRLSRVDGGVEIESAPAAPEALTGAVRAYLRLDDDLPSVQAELRRDRRVREGIDAYPGLRLLRQEPWETLAGFILSSTSNIPRISRTIELIATSFGEPRSLSGATRHTFPPPAVLAEAGEGALRALGCGFRAPYLVTAARAVATGELPLEALRGAAHDDAAAALTALHGVGDKIADCVMLFSLDRLDAFPIDRWVLRALTDWYGVGKLNYAGARSWALRRFGANAGYANQYLFWRRRQSR